jgi:hypothetical protein
VLLIAVWCGYGLIVYPLLDASSSARELMLSARQAAGPGTSIGLVDWKEQNFLQAVGPTVEFGFSATRSQQLQRAQAWQAAEPVQRRILIPDAETGADVCLRLDAAHAQRIGKANRRDWWLAGADAFVAPCQ